MQFWKQYKKTPTDRRQLLPSEALAVVGWRSIQWRFMGRRRQKSKKPLFRGIRSF
jgi:hypothetical protein